MTKTALRFAVVAGLSFSFASVDVSFDPAGGWPQGLTVKGAQAARKPKPKPKADKKDEKKADDKKAAATEAPKEELRTTGPANIKREAFSEKAFENSAKAEKKRDETINEIKALLGKLKPEDERRGELVFRLAEIYWQKSKYIYQKEFKEFDEGYQKWVDNGRGGKEPQLATFISESDAYKKQALQNYAIILDKFPNYPRLDEVLFIMAFNQYEAGKSKEAIDNYSQLIRQYPKSEYVSDSYLALGEHYFKANDLTKATKAYQKAYDKGIEDKRKSVFNYARYKLAWCDYNAQEFDKALTKFKAVVAEENKDDPKTGPAKSGVNLKREALNDMVLTYSHLDATKEAYDYLKKESNAVEAYRLSGKLAAVYKEQGKHALEVDTLRMLINLDPDNTGAPDYQSSIVLAYSNLGDRPAVRKEVTRLVELYRPGASWWRKNEANPALVDRARTVAENRMRELVTDYHRFAQKFKKVDDYETAADIYSQYLQAFPDSENAYRLNFFYAELLWDLGKWRDSAAQYDAVVKRDAKGEYTRTCAYNAVLAWEKIVNKTPETKFEKGIMQSDSCTDDDVKKGKKCTPKKQGEIEKKKQTLVKYCSPDEAKKGLCKAESYEPKKIPEDEISLSNACDAYVAVVPQKDIDKEPKLKEELINVKFKSAYIYQGYFHFDEAAKRFGELIERWPETEAARKGADQILDSYAARENYPALEKWSRDFTKQDKLMGDKEFAKAVARFMEGATFKNVDAVRNAAVAAKDKSEKTRLGLEAATRFEAFIKEFASSEFAPIALYNAQQIYAVEDQIDLAILTGDQLLKQYGKEISSGDNLKNKLEETTIINLGAYHEKVANYPKAAETYVKFADKYKDHPKAPDLIYNAGIFYLGLGDTKNATGMFARYIKDFPKQKDIPDVYLRMASVYEDQEDWKRASAMYGEFEKLHGKNATPVQVLSARYKTAVALQKAGRDKDMLEACEGILANYKKIDEKLRKSETGQLAGGYCAFQTLEREFLAYKGIQIEVKAGASGKKAMQLVKSALDDKLKQRDVIAKKYFDVLAYGNGEWGIAGLSRAADALLDYVNTLRNAPDPPPLRDNPEALDLFRTELENIAFPVEEQGILALESALTKAFELGIYSQYTVEIEDKLKKFKPAKFGRVYELSFYPSSSDGTAKKTASR
ncbi:MAG: tetratricopeptide repeat protein [Deltaproteobacteria bacterium]|nr:tetratricopeptide repeat protein [Deltaproteobacteria bacterium]